MNIIQTDIEGVVIIEPKVFADERDDVVADEPHDLGDDG